MPHIKESSIRSGFPLHFPNMGVSDEKGVAGIMYLVFLPDGHIQSYEHCEGESKGAPHRFVDYPNSCA